MAFNYLVGLRVKSIDSLRERTVLTTTEEDEGGITKTLKLRQIEPEFLSRMFEGEV